MYLLLVLFITLISSFALASNDGFIVFRGSNHDIKSIPEDNVVDLLSHVNGLPPVHQEVNRNNYPKTDLFSSPSANIFVAIDSISTDMLNNIEAKFLNIENENVIDMISNVYPEDSLSSVTSILSGKDYSDHGIVGHSWRASSSMSITSFSKNGNCKVPKITDRFSRLSDGSATVISVSGSKQMAAALGVHTELFENNPNWNCESVYFAKNRGLVSLYSDDTINTLGSIRFEAKKRSVTLKSAEGYVLVAELLAISEIPNRIKAMHQSGTHIPDFIGIGIESIKLLSIKYGQDSEQVKDALQRIDVALSKMYAKLELFYEKEIITEIVGVKSSTEDHTFYSQQKQQQFAKMIKEEPVSTDDEDTGYTADEVTAFQTKFWVAISLIIAAIIATLALVNMDKLENSLIYKTTDGPRPIQNVH